MRESDSAVAAWNLDVHRAGLCRQAEHVGQGEGCTPEISSSLHTENMRQPSGEVHWFCPRPAKAPLSTEAGGLWSTTSPKTLTTPNQ